MGRVWLPVVLVCIAMVGAAATPVPVAAQDDWPDSCGTDVQMVEPGAYSGTLSPNDEDVIRIDLDEGDYISYTLEIDSPSSEQSFFVQANDGSLTESDGTQLEADTGPDPTVVTLQAGATGFNMQPGDVQHRAYSKRNDGLCMRLGSLNDGTGEWRFAFEINEASPPPVGGGDNGEVAELEQELEEKNETIQEQEERIAELEAQLDAADGGQNVTINVEVQPGGDNQAYIDGGTAVVSADSEQADLSQMTVRYNGEDYRLMDGDLALTLQGTGMQELQFQYGDTTETAMIDVQESDSATATSDQDDGTSPSDGEDEESPSSNEDSSADDESAGDDEASTGGEDESPSGEEESLPGFGVVVTLIALLFASSIFVYRRRS